MTYVDTNLTQGVVSTLISVLGAATLEADFATATSGGSTQADFFARATDIIHEGPTATLTKSATLETKPTYLDSVTS